MMYSTFYILQVACKRDFSMRSKLLMDQKLNI